MTTPDFGADPAFVASPSSRQGVSTEGFNRGEGVQPYRPANATEGVLFEMRFCDACIHDRAFRETNGEEDGCPILANAYIFSVGEPGFPKEWIEDDLGPRCTEFEEDSE